MRRAAAEHNALDRGFASAAGLPRPVVNAMLLLIAAFDAIAIHVIPQAAPAIAQGAQRQLDGTVQPLHFVFRQLIGGRERMNRGEEKRFIRVDIADARHDRLIQ